MILGSKLKPGNVSVFLLLRGNDIGQEVGPGVSRLTTLWQAVGDDEGLDVEVIDIKQEVGKSKAEDAEGK